MKFTIYLQVYYGIRKDKSFKKEILEYDIKEEKNIS